MKYREAILAILAALYSSLALADDFKTTDGKNKRQSSSRPVIQF
jgi:hypothetical protein